MAENDTQETKTLPIPIRATGGGAAQAAPGTVDAMYSRVMDTIANNTKVLGALQVTNALARGTKEMGEDGHEPRSSLKDVADAANLMGINIGEMVKESRQEARDLQTAKTETERELHGERLKSLETLAADIKAKADEIGAARQAAGAGDVGTALGLGPLTEETRTRLQARVFGISDKPAGSDKPADPADPLAPLKAVDGMMETVFNLAKRFGFTSPSDAKAAAASAGGSMVTMEDIKTGRMPVELALGIRKLELDKEVRALEINYQHEVEMKRVSVLEGLKNIFQDNIGDAIGAWKDTAQGYNRQAALGAPPTDNGHAPAAPQPMGIVCPNCKEEFAVLKRAPRYTCPFCTQAMELPDGSQQATAASQPPAAAAQPPSEPKGEELPVP